MLSIVHGLHDVAARDSAIRLPSGDLSRDEHAHSPWRGHMPRYAALACALATTRHIKDRCVLTHGGDDAILCGNNG